LSMSNLTVDFSLSALHRRPATEDKRISHSCAQGQLPRSTPKAKARHAYSPFCERANDDLPRRLIMIHPTIHQLLLVVILARDREQVRVNGGPTSGHG
jgi:hypothetical protein